MKKIFILNCEPKLLILLSLCLLTGCAGTGATTAKQSQLAALNGSLVEKTKLLQDNSASYRSTIDSQAMKIAAMEKNLLQKDQVIAEKDAELQAKHTEVASLKSSRSKLEKNNKILSASLERRGGVAFLPNNSLVSDLPQIDPTIGTAELHNGTVRVIIPTVNLFATTKSVSITTEGDAALRSVASEIRSHYPKSQILVEGHTSNAPLASPMWRDHTHLATSRATAVRDKLAKVTQFGEDNLALAAFGDSQPRYANNSPDGQQQNDRIELVIRP